MTIAQKADRRNNISHGTESSDPTFVVHNRLGNDRFIIRFRSDDMV